MIVKKASMNVSMKWWHFLTAFVCKDRPVEKIVSTVCLIKVFVPNVFLSNFLSLKFLGQST